MTHLRRALVGALTVLSITAFTASASSAAPAEKGFGGVMQMRDVWCC